MLNYDPTGRLYQTSGSATTRFLYDGQALIGEYDAADNRLRRYIHGGGTDEPLIWYEGSGDDSGFGDRRYLHSDERDSIIAITNAAGNAITLNSYDDYGIQASGNAGRFQYTGQTWIPDLGMYYYKARIWEFITGYPLMSVSLFLGPAMMSLMSAIDRWYPELSFVLRMGCRPDRSG